MTDRQADGHSLAPKAQLLVQLARNQNYPCPNAYFHQTTTKAQEPF